MMKKEARLTGALLARKGQAIPSPAAPKFSMPAINRFENAAPENSVEESQFSARTESNLEETIESVKRLSEVQGKKNIATDEKHASTVGRIFGRRKPEGKTAKVAKTRQKRIAMTLRMTEEEHLKLRLYSAHTRKSCQEVLTEALDMYLADQADHICSDKKCSCLAE